MAGGVVIVGAGECGARTALALREQGFGGIVTLISSDPHLPYERPPLSKGLLSGLASSPTMIADLDRLQSLQIGFVQAEVTALDPRGHSVLLGSERVSYDTLLLATGARPRKLDASGVVYLRSMADCLALRTRICRRARVVVIGGGFLGLEIAASARSREAEVVVLETQPRLMQRGVPHEIAMRLRARHEEAGVTVHCRVTIDKVDELGVTLSEGTRYNADVVVAAVGAIPNTELAALSGLAVNNGILVDKTLRTSAPDIFAAGDCCAFPLSIYSDRVVRLESWRSAGEQALTAARNLMGAEEPFERVPWFWSDQYDLTLQVAGITDASNTSVRRDLGNGAFLLFEFDQDGRLVAASGLGPGNAIARDIKVAEMLIAQRAHPRPEKLGDGSVKLKSLLSA